MRLRRMLLQKMGQNHCCASMIFGIGIFVGFGFHMSWLFYTRRVQYVQETEYDPHGISAEITTRSEQMFTPMMPPSKLEPRSKFNGIWYGSDKRTGIYIYSAFYDTRGKAHQQPAVVRVIMVGNEGLTDIYCNLLYDGHWPPVVKRAKLGDLGAGVDLPEYGGAWKESLVTCDLDRQDQPPQLVTLTGGEKTPPQFWAPVEVLPETQPEHEFAVCVSVAYWQHDPHRLVEWLELNRLWGVGKIWVYNNSLPQEAAKVFKLYDQEGLVEFRQSHNFVEDSDEVNIHLHMSPVINDCMYRNMYKAGKVIVTDLDEMIVPQQHSNYHDMAIAIEKSQPSQHPHRSYLFRNAYYFLNYMPEEKNETEKLVTLRHQMRLTASEFGYAVKTIQDPLTCLRMHNHYCWEVLSYMKGDGYAHSVWDVRTDIAMLHHYKNCHMTERECMRESEKAFKDSSATRFRYQLVPAVNKQLTKLGLTQV